MGHLLVTNDFPPKIGGIQSYLWELWRRLPVGEATVLTTPHANHSVFDAAAPMSIIRTRQRWLLPTPSLERQIVATANQHNTDLVILDPALPVGWLGPRLRRHGLRYGLVLHGAEVTVPGRLPLLRSAMAHVLSQAELVIAAGGYSLAEAEHAAGMKLPSVVIPPGIDIDRFSPAPTEAKPALRTGLGLPASGPLIVSTSRLVPRKGRDVLIRAGAALHADFPDLCIAISGSGRDRKRLLKLAAKYPQLDARLLGRLTENDLADLYRCSDVFVMLCRNRWFGLEQEGFGIVFLEAAASGVAQVAGRSGGSHEAVLDGKTGVIVDQPKSFTEAAQAIRSLLTNHDQRTSMGAASRMRAVEECTYDLLAGRLLAALQSLDQCAPGNV